MVIASMEPEEQQNVRISFPFHLPRIFQATYTSGTRIDPWGWLWKPVAVHVEISSSKLGNKVEPWSKSARYLVSGTEHAVKNKH